MHLNKQKWSHWFTWFIPWDALLKQMHASTHLLKNRSHSWHLFCPMMHTNAAMHKWIKEDQRYMSSYALHCIAFHSGMHRCIYTHIAAAMQRLAAFVLDRMRCSKGYAMHRCIWLHSIIFGDPLGHLLLHCIQCYDAYLSVGSFLHIIPAMHLPACIPVLVGGTPHLWVDNQTISTGRLHISRCLHLPPIKVMVFHLDWEYVSSRVSRLDAVSGSPIPT